MCALRMCVCVSYGYGLYVNNSIYMCSYIDRKKKRFTNLSFIPNKMVLKLGCLVLCPSRAANPML